MDILHSILFAAHMLGLAAIIGSFFVQLRRKSDFVLGPTLYGAIVQVVTGVGLVGVGEATGDDIDMIKVTVKLGIAVIVLVAAILAVVTQRKGGKVQPWFHAAGGLAVVNVLVAVFW
ncbi:MAG: hypothetical protein WA006_03610 [Rhodoglobus sp.]